MRVEVRDEARDDLVMGAVFYSKQAPGLDDYFLECLQTDLRDLETTFGVHETYRGFHRSLSTRFPFAIYYQVIDHGHRPWLWLAPHSGAEGWLTDDCSACLPPKRICRTDSPVSRTVVPWELQLVIV